jgi:REP element-mobilizing transposase RayT
VKPTRLMSPPGTYFVSFATWRRRRLFVVERYARLFLRTIYAYRRQRKFQLHAFVLMPEHVHLLFTPAEDVTLECGCSSLRAATRVRSGLSLENARKFGREVSRTIGFGIVQILKGTGDTFTTIPWHAGSWIGRWNIATARHIQDSNWTHCPQRLKPSLNKRESARVELVPFPSGELCFQ